MAEERLFDRRARVTVLSTSTPLFEDSYDIKVEPHTNGLVIEDQRIEFEIEHNLKKHPNSCTIRITNLNEETRSAFKKTPLRVTLEAGYADRTSTIFTGDVIYAMSALDGSDWVTMLQVGDGDRVIGNARVNKSYAAGVKKISIIEDALKALGQQVPDNIRNHPAFQKVVQGGMALYGKHTDVLDSLLKPEGFSMSIQDNQPMILSEDTAVGQTYTISEENGMIGSPEFGRPSRKGKAPDVTVRSLLYPEIRPGHPVNVTTRDLNGLFKVKDVKHKGDTHGTDWMTTVEIKPMSWSPKDDKRKTKSKR